MSRYILMPAAQEDLADIRDYYLEEAGSRVARQMLVEFVEAFRFLSRTPGAGTFERTWPKTGPFCSGRCATTLFSISPRPTPLEILSIFRGSCNVPSLIGKRKL